MDLEWGITSSRSGTGPFWKAEAERCSNRGNLSTPFIRFGDFLPRSQLRAQEPLSHELRIEGLSTF